MICVRRISGQEIAAVSLQDFKKWGESGEQPILTLKRHLTGRCGSPRFKQRLLLQDGTVLLDDALLDAPAEVQLVLLDFSEASQEDVLELQAAARRNNISKVEDVLQRPQDPDVVEGGKTPLFSASHRGHAGVVRLLLEARADTNKARLDDGTTPLVAACSNGHLEVASLLLDSGADKDKVGKQGGSPLLLACQNGHLQVVHALLKAGADADKVCDRGATPLCVACQQGQAEVVGMLLQSRVDVNKARKNGSTPLSVACQQGGSEVGRASRAVLQAGVEASLIQRLQLAYQHRRMAIIRALLRAQADANGGASMAQGRSPLYMACQQGHEEVVRILLEASADKNKADDDGSTPLLTACAEGHLQVIQLLLEAGADSDQACPNGDTPLAVASRRGHHQIVQRLLRAGEPPLKRARLN